MENREKFSTRLGFILLSVGCAVGLGNIWRFPYITGQYGGALFVLIYLAFVIMMGIPIMTMEFSVGRASQRSAATSFHVLEPKGSKWHIFSWFAMAGNYLLMMFYTTISGWILFYFFYMIRGDFVGLTPDQVGANFGAHVGSPFNNIMGMILVCAIGFLICAIGLRKGVERITKIMMSCLFIIMIILAVRAVTLPGAAEGLRFYLVPNLDAVREYGLGEILFAAMGQAFFTLSLGIGSMAIFGSYIGKERSLMGESVNVVALDTFAALMAGLIIFPACFAFGVNPGGGPGLIFVTLPNIFNEMPLGRFWGILFFLFLLFAALSTVVAVFENIVAFAMDKLGWARKKASVVNGAAVVLLSLPCALGFNVWSGIRPFGGDSAIIDLEDFILSNNLLPLGALVYLLFCVYKSGWGWENFLEEANSGKGLKFPRAVKPYVQFVLPILFVAVFVFGYINFFSS
ncbi:MAG: sodium-dependent transporter [Oscillospiraceae bacterium]|nr:sodium-dependent transporter [Oscillospiraceae bacterium]